MNLNSLLIKLDLSEYEYSMLIRYLSELAYFRSKIKNGNIEEIKDFIETITDKVKSN